MLQPLQLCRSNFIVCVVKMAVDKAESGLVHSGMGAGQNASPTEVWEKKMAASDLVLTGLR